MRVEVRGDVRPTEVTLDLAFEPLEHAARGPGLADLAFAGHVVRDLCGGQIDLRPTEGGFVVQVDLPLSAPPRRA